MTIQSTTSSKQVDVSGESTTNAARIHVIDTIPMKELMIILQFRGQTEQCTPARCVWRENFEITTIDVNRIGQFVARLLFVLEQIALFLVKFLLRQHTR